MTLVHTHSSVDYTLPCSPEEAFLTLEPYEARVTSAKRLLFLNQLSGPILFLFMPDLEDKITEQRVTGSSQDSFSSLANKIHSMRNRQSGIWSRG